MRGARRAAAVVIGVVAASTVAGCAWFGRKPPPASAPSAPAAPSVTAPPLEPAAPAAAVRVACPNEPDVYASSTYPRDAILRGLDHGEATVRFAVDGTTITILSVTSSDPAFGAAGTAMVRKLACRVDTRTVFELPFGWRTAR